jgi:hypothetical protein
MNGGTLGVPCHPKPDNKKPAEAGFLLQGMVDVFLRTHGWDIHEGFF